MKIGNLLNIASIKALTASATAFNDAAPGLTLGEDLIAVNQKVLEKKYPELVFLNSGLQADNTGGYAEAVRSLRLNEEGGYQIAGSQSGNKGKISLSNDSSLLEVVAKSAESTWTTTEVQQAALSNINLVEKFVAAHNKVYQREVDATIAFGTGKAGSEGLLNNSEFVASAASDDAATLAAASGEDLYNEISVLITDQHSDVEDIEEYSANVVIMPTRVKNIAAKTILDTAGGSKTVLTALKENFPEVKFLSSNKCDSDELAASVVVAFSTSDEAMVTRIPQPITFAPVFQHGFKFESESQYRIAGLDLYEPKAGRILTGL